MRTVILLGLTAIADAINKNWLTDKDCMNFLAIVLFCVIIMDIAEFIINMYKKL